MTTRRSFMQGMAVAGLAAPFFPAEKTKPTAKLKLPRVIYNDDGDDLDMPAYGGYLDPIEDMPNRLDSVDQFLGLRLKALAGTQVDSLYFCGYTNLPNWEFPKERIAALGPDALKHVVEFAHSHKMEFVYSIRMNDIHSAFSPGPVFWPPFKLENPHLLQVNVNREEFEKRFLPWIQQKVKEHPLADMYKRTGLGSREYFSWSAYDYVYPEVREHFLKVVEGACERYDLQGVELDWMRAPFYFKFGQEARHIPVLNDFVRLVRQRLDYYGKQRGKRIQLIMRMPDTVARSTAVGLDVEIWLRKGWFDVLIVGGGYAPFTIDLTEWLRLGRQHAIPVYPAINRSVVPNDPPQMRAAMRAAAYRFWDEGVDGIYTFNQFFHPSDTECLKEIGDPTMMRRMDKLYYFDQDCNENGYLNSTCWPGELPLCFTAQSGPAEETISLKIADQPETATQVRVELQWKTEVEAQRASFTLNGQPLTQAKQLPGEYDVFSKQTGKPWTSYETKALRKGVNHLRVTVRPPTNGNPAEIVTLEQARIAIRYS